MNSIEKVILQQIEEIDISETSYKQAEERYQSIGNWLQRDDSKLSTFSPDIYTQGSFALGTVIKPLDNNEDYDIDLVCHLKTEKYKYTQKEIKTILGEEIQKYAQSNNMSNTPEEGRRCWTMIYASSNNSAGFHLDALPSISSLSYSNAKQQYKRDKQTDVFQINITDNERENYDKIADDWNVSNPKGYAEWFKSKQQIAIATEKNNYTQKIIASGISDRTQDVPIYAIKTPLQKAIQFLKRHRDIYFQDSGEVKPISIIITTLVAQTHDETNSNVIDIIKHFIKTHHSYITGDDFIPNPVNPEENFADKWTEYPERKKAFYKWVEQLEKNFLNLHNMHLLGRSDNHVIKLLRKSESNTKYSRPKNNPPAINFNVPHRQDLQFPIVTDKKVSITAKYKKKCKGSRTMTLRCSQPIAKDNQITFRVHAKYIRGRKKYYWQVVNTGYEAVTVNNCPRGNFYDGEKKRGGRTRVEETLYKGTHWVQCFVVQNGKCVAKSSEFIVKIQ